MQIERYRVSVGRGGLTSRGGRAETTSARADRRRAGTKYAD
ncbi:hypothetical protein [Halegenticoccus tardaugens]|nr:hypothetical protein [Halegenticoccus tardaugens]